MRQKEEDQRELHQREEDQRAEHQRPEEAQNHLGDERSQRWKADQKGADQLAEHQMGLHQTEEGRKVEHLRGEQGVIQRAEKEQTHPEPERWQQQPMEQGHQMVVGP